MRRDDDDHPEEAEIGSATSAEAVGGGEPVGVPSAVQAVRSLVEVVGRSGAVGREMLHLGVEIGRVLLGRSELAPSPRDRRFTDPAWSQNPLFRRLVQAYLAAAGTLDALVDDLDSHVEDRLAEQARFTASILAAAAAPTNMLVTNPAGLKRAFDTGGASLLRGLRNMADDVVHNGGMPATVEPGVFQVGRDLALTPGTVVVREPLAELIQYTPTTEQVRERPVLIVPPPIGRFYFLDLRPGRSFVEFAVANQLPTFLLSWCNPGPAARSLGPPGLRRPRCSRRSTTSAPSPAAPMSTSSASAQAGSSAAPC